MQANPVNAYKQTRVRTASQGRIIVMLYDEAIRQLDLATRALSEGVRAFDRVNSSVSKTQEIITELMVALDFEKGGAFAQSMFNLYMFFNRQLTDANLQKNGDDLTKVRGFLAELRDAWNEAEKKTMFDGGPASGVNVAG